jgi:hypothetical protein
VNVKSKEKNSEDICLDFVQEFGLCYFCCQKEQVPEKNNRGQIIRSISIRINRDFLKTAKKHDKKLLNNTQPSVVHIQGADDKLGQTLWNYSNQ